MSAIAACRRDMSRQKAAAAGADVAARKLRNNPDDPEANFTRGYYVAVVKDQWSAGLPLLAKGANTGFKAAAQRELSFAQGLDAKIAVGDAWWDLAQSESGPAQSAIRRHAASWYSQVVGADSLTGLRRVRIERRVAQLAPTTAPAEVAVAPKPTGAPLLSPRNWKVVLFMGSKNEEPIFRGISRGQIAVIKGSDVASKLRDPGTWSVAGIVVIGVNRFRDLTVADLTPSVQNNLKAFVENGGDLFFFEQSDQGNMSVIKDLFGVETRGGPFPGVEFVAHGLEQRAGAVGYTARNLEDVRFYNGYEMPNGSTVLVRDGKGKIATVGVVPQGKGRLVLIGANLSPSDEKLVEILLNYLFNGSPNE